MACYRPPYTDNENNFFNSVEKILGDSDATESLILGDLNYNMLNEYHSAKLVEFNAINGFTNTILKPTYTRSGSLLDVILTDSYPSLVASNVIPCPISDHDLGISIFSYSSSRLKASMISSRCLNASKINELKLNIVNLFKNYDISIILCVNARWDLIKIGIHCIHCLSKVAPVKSFKVKNVIQLPWYDKELTNLSHKRNKAYNNWIKSKFPTDREKYVSARTLYNFTLRAKKSKYYRDFVSDNSL